MNGNCLACKCPYQSLPKPKEMQYLPIPGSVKEMVSQKLAMGVTTERILDGGLLLLIPVLSHIKAEAYFYTSQICQQASIQDRLQVWISIMQQPFYSTSCSF